MWRPGDGRGARAASAPRGESQAQAGRGRPDARQDDPQRGARKKVVAPARWREIVAWSRVAYRLSQRRACGALEVARSSVRYIGRRPPQMALRRRLREIAEVRLHYGDRRMHGLLRRVGGGG